MEEAEKRQHHEKLHNLVLLYAQGETIGEGTLSLTDIDSDIINTEKMIGYNNTQIYKYWNEQMADAVIAALSGLEIL